MLQRDMELAELTGARYHAAQVSTDQFACDVIRRAKGQGA